MSDDDVGYGKPPKQHRFKKGQSGCPDGGAAIKRAKKAKARIRKDEISPQQMVVNWFTEKKRVKLNGKSKRLTRLELALLQLDEDVHVKRDPQARKLFFDIAQKNGWLKAPPPKTGRTGVLVVYPILTPEEWEKRTEGERLPKDPLHGIPGAEGLLDNPPRRRLAAPDEDD